MSVANGVIGTGVAARGRAGQGRRGGRPDPGDARLPRPQVGVGSPPRSRSPTPGWASTGWPGRFVSNGSAPSSARPTWSGELDRLAKPDKQVRAEPAVRPRPRRGDRHRADDGFTFNAKGMVTVEFPRPAVIFSVIATVISETAPVQQRRGAGRGGLSIIGLVVIDDTAVTSRCAAATRSPGSSSRGAFGAASPMPARPVLPPASASTTSRAARDHRSPSTCCRASSMSRPRRTSWSTATGWSSSAATTTSTSKASRSASGSGSGSDWSAGRSG